MAKDRRTKEQKRHAKLKERAHAQSEKVTAYEGGKYRQPQWTEAIMQTEIGIYEVSFIIGPKLTNEHVREALEHLVLALRKGISPVLTAEESENPGEPVDFVMWNIRRNWGIFFKEKRKLAKEDLIGILRTLLSSIQAQQKRLGPALGYLHFLKVFMGKLGVKVESMPAQEVP